MEDARCDLASGPHGVNALDPLALRFLTVASEQMLESQTMAIKPFSPTVENADRLLEIVPT